ncbi:helix-turn-helix transcriptional regulator [Dyadobacter sp. 3J3]|uniref:ArsR/SmtB family transcription factor n=1 Tax=Dyadobacter sp. 3J3 TaxID=2606600 RepID=UPI001358B6C1|nr:metalloregulator ArsR/SmtB family transcription factor [Dyadobacter sp. 3J3]
MNQPRRDVFQAIADPTRREIINLLSARSMNLNAVVEKFEMSRPAVAKHIRILSECGLITVQMHGREKHIKADLKKLKQLSDWTDKYSKFWNEKLDALGDFLDHEQKNS